jgi:hypothetical protein
VERQRRCPRRALNFYKFSEIVYLHKADGRARAAGPVDQRRNTMNRRSLLCISAVTALTSSLLLDASAATKAKVSKKQLIGNWILAANTAANGRPFGPNDGYATFSAAGRFAITLVRSDLPKFASNNRDTGSADENKAIVQGTNAYFGTYSLNEADGTLTLHIERASSPNWVGTDQQRQIASLTATELKYTNPAASTGGTAELTWKRSK